MTEQEKIDSIWQADLQLGQKRLRPPGPSETPLLDLSITAVAWTGKMLWKGGKWAVKAAMKNRKK